MLGPMTDDLPDEARAVLDFWFGALDADGLADPDHAAGWWSADPDFDESVREHFGALHDEVCRGGRRDWLETPRGRLAYVIVLDQFSRNLHRGDPRSWAWDGRALEVALEGIDRGEDEALGPHERAFLYMPLMHAEDRRTQNRCVTLFAACEEPSEGRVRDEMARYRGYAERHRAVVERFGRFPHRNEVLGRTSTGDEVAYLAKNPAGF